MKRKSKHQQIRAGDHWLVRLPDHTELTPMVVDTKFVKTVEMHQYGICGGTRYFAWADVEFVERIGRNYC